MKGVGKTLHRVRKLKLLIAYDGTRFAGWQTQKNGRTVQETLEQALRQLTGKRVPVTGAGRTDSGVHAEGQVAHAVVTSRLSLREIHKALNAILPADLVVQSVEIAHLKFHARYSAESKRYRYRIWNSPLRPLFGREQLHHVPAHLDLSAMRRAARRLSGRRDFQAFHSVGRPVHSTLRTVKRISLNKTGSLITLEIEADGFLYHMVRRITGLLIEVGKGKPAPSIPPTAPAKGLCLIEVRY